MQVCPVPMQISVYCHSPVDCFSFNDIKRLQDKNKVNLPQTTGTDTFNLVVPNRTIKRVPQCCLVMSALQSH